jgi:hypothetical protein
MRHAMDGNALMQRREEVLAHYHSPTCCRQAGRQAERRSPRRGLFVLLLSTLLRYATLSLHSAGRLLR